MKKYSTFRRAGPDVLTEELMAAFAGDICLEFKPLFLLVHEHLRSRNAANCGEEMLRLRVYEKLQNLVRLGGVEKNGKSYRGIAAGLQKLTEQIAAALSSTRKAPPRKV